MSTDDTTAWAAPAEHQTNHPGPVGAPTAPWPTSSAQAAHVPHQARPPHGEVAVPQPAPPMTLAPLLPQTLKDTTAAWLLWFFLGNVGAHDFYLRRPGAAAAKIVMTVIGWATCWLLIGFVPLLAVAVWWIVDACTMGGRLQQLNQEIHAHNQHVAAMSPHVAGR